MALELTLKPYCGMLKYFNQASQLTMEGRFTNKPAKICKKTHTLVVHHLVILNEGRYYHIAHSRHHHEDAGNSHEDVCNGHNCLVSRDSQNHRCGCVGHQHYGEHE